MKFRDKGRPNWITLLDQPDFPTSIPLLQLLPATDGVLRIVEAFEIHELTDAVASRKTIDKFLAMFVGTADEVIGYADIQRTTNLIRENVDLEISSPYY